MATHRRRRRGLDTSRCVGAVPRCTTHTKIQTISCWQRQASGSTHRWSHRVRPATCQRVAIAGVRTKRTAPAYQPTRLPAYPPGGAHSSATEPGRGAGVKALQHVNSQHTHTPHSRHTTRVNLNKHCSLKWAALRK